MDLHIAPNQFTPQIKTPVSRHNLFEVVLLVIIIVLFYWFIVSPKKASLNEVRAQYYELEQKKQKLADSKGKLQKAMSELNSHPKEVVAMDEALPLDNRVTKLYIVLDSLTKGSGMTVGNIGIAYNGAAPMAGDKALLANPYGAKRAVQKLTTSINVTGSFEQFQALLQKLENSGRLINMSDLTIAQAQDNLLDFNVNLESYYFH